MDQEHAIWMELRQNCDVNPCSANYWIRAAAPSRSVVSGSLRPHGPHSARLLCPRDSPGKKTGVGCHALLQGISPTQDLNPGLLRWASLVAQMIKNLPAVQETRVRSLGWEDPLEKEMATHSSAPA